MLLDLNKLIDKYSMNITGVIHVGAHRYEEAPIYEKCGIKNVKWFEANKDLCNPQHDTHNVAITDGVKNVTLHITNNMASSSIMPLKDHLKHYPNIKEIETRSVLGKPLRDYQSKKYNMLNLDIQGAELQALKGAELSYIDYIYTEVNYEELYEGCNLIDEITLYLNNYELVDVSNTKRGWGDALYIRK